MVGMARAAFPENQKIWQALQDDYSLIRKKIESVLPELFENYNEKITQLADFDCIIQLLQGNGTQKLAKLALSLNRYQFSKCQLAN